MNKKKGALVEPIVSGGVSKQSNQIHVAMQALKSHYFSLPLRFINQNRHLSPTGFS